MDNSNDVRASPAERSLTQPHTLTASNASRPSVQNVHNPNSSPQLILRHSPDVESGRSSVIKDYCLQAIKEGHTKCIWLCIKRGRRWIAKDIRPAEWNSSWGVYELRKMCGWWKRHSLYSAVGVKEIMIRFIDFNKSKNEIEVVAIDFDYDTLRTSLEKATERALEDDFEPLECGIDIMGRCHDDNTFCANTVYDSIDENYCRIKHVNKLKLQRDNYRWLSSMLEFYWQNGVGREAMEFLEGSQFVTQYRYLTEDRYTDAANPYGKTVNAFMLIEGWHVHYLLCLVAVGLLCSICVVAITTAVTQSFEAGLSAGSYALGLAAVLLAVLTFLSAVL